MGGESGVHVGGARRSTASPEYLKRFHRAPGARPVFGLPEPSEGAPQYWRPRYSQAPYVWDSPQAGWAAARATVIGKRVRFLGMVVAFGLYYQSVRWDGTGWDGWWRLLERLSISSPIRPDVLALWLGLTVGALFSATSSRRRAGVGLCSVLMMAAYLAGDSRLNAAHGRWLFVAAGTFGAAAWLVAKRRNRWSVLAALLAAPLAMAVWEKMRAPDFTVFMLGSIPKRQDYVLLEGLAVWATVLAVIVAVWAGVLVDKVLPRAQVSVD